MSTDSIVGRRRELDALRMWLAAARDGRGRLVLCAGEPGIGKTRLAQELAGRALAAGVSVAWGRCLEARGAPAFWPWRQVLRSLGADPDVVLEGGVESPEDRFRVFDEVSETVLAAAGAAGAGSGLVVILDDVQWADEPSLLVLRHLANHVASARLLVLSTLRDDEPGSALPRVLPDLVRSPAVERLDLRGFDLAEVGEQLSRTAGVGSPTDARAVLDLTGGNPLFVREVGRAMADGTWRPDRPPRTVLDVVTARLDRVSPECRRLVQAAAVAGRDFSLPLVARALDQPLAECLPAVDEAIAHGLVQRAGEAGAYRFAHALTREAVEASLATSDRISLHRAVAEAVEAQFAGDLSEHLGDIARHWAELAPYGEAETARAWAIRAAGEAVRRLAYEHGVRLYRAALAFPAAPLPAAERGRVLIALGRAAYFAGDLRGCAEAATAAADAARAAGDAHLVGEAALVLEAVPDPVINAVAKQLCDQALAALGETADDALRARLLAQRSHLAFYDGEQDRVEVLSAAALALARASSDDRAIADAIRARKEACPGPTGRAERMALAVEMLALASRTSSARTAMWAHLWRIDALVESGQLTAAADALSGLQVAVEGVGGPVGAWHLDRVTAYIAQARGRYSDAAAAARRAFERMRPVEPGPAHGAYAALLTALARHVGVTGDAAPLVEGAIDPLPRFRTLAPLARAFLLLCAGRREEAAASYELAGPLEAWSLPAFFVLPGHVYAALVAAELGRHHDLEVLLGRLEPFRREHVVGEGVFYLGPVELTLGRAAAAMGDLDRAVADLGFAAEAADRASARGFAAEARYHLATVLAARDEAGDSERALSSAAEADRQARALGMSAYFERTGALLAHLGATRPVALSPREVEVAKLVAEGLSNRQIAERLVISERTAQNHVQHILTKLGFSSRSQIAAWAAGVSR
ncbi:MAG TPA: AAA family ATPase [Acidimicrobiales bacterium]|nr:AAA family ATPase [Acidimicrobiales bacterium]